MLSFMLEGEPHLKVVDKKRDSGKTRKLQVCSASVCVRVCACVCVRVCSHWLYMLHGTCNTLEAPPTLHGVGTKNIHY